MHTVKKGIFPSPAGMSLTKLSKAGNNSIIPGQGEFGLGTGKSLTFYNSAYFQSRLVFSILAIVH
jgi:hypothetical protein